MLLGSASPFGSVVMDLSDMPVLEALEQAQQLLQDADSILYPPCEQEDRLAPATDRKKRISVADLWSTTAPSTSSIPEDCGVVVDFPESSSMSSSTPRMCLQSLFDAESPPAPAPAEDVAVDFNTVFPCDRLQVLEWHPNRSLLALVEVISASVGSSVPRRRLRKKGFCATLVLSSMATKTYKPGRLNKGQRTNGRDLYRRVMAVVTGRSIRQVYESTSANWQNLSMDHQHAWADLARVFATPTGSEWAVRLRLKMPQKGSQNLASKKQSPNQGPPGTNLTGYGFSLCFNTDFGQKNIETVKVVQSGLRGAELREALVKIPEYEQFFDRFYSHFQKLGREVGAPLVAGCMEHSEHGDHPARVHLHCFLGIDIRGGIYGRAPQELTVTKGQLTFEGLRPSIGLTTCSRRRNLAIHTSVVQCYYYVAGPKLGCLFSRGEAVLFKDDAQRLAVRSACYHGSNVTDLLPASCKWGFWAYGMCESTFAEDLHIPWK